MSKLNILHTSKANTMTRCSVKRALELQELTRTRRERCMNDSPLIACTACTTIGATAGQMRILSGPLHALAVTRCRNSAPAGSRSTTGLTELTPSGVERSRASFRRCVSHNFALVLVRGASHARVCCAPGASVSFWSSRSGTARYGTVTRRERRRGVQRTGGSLNSDERCACRPLWRQGRCAGARR